MAIDIDAAQIAEQAVEETIDGVVEVVEVVRNNPILLGVVAGLGLIAGGVGGYFFAKNQLRSYYEDLSQDEIAEAKEFYSGFYKVDPSGQGLSPKDVMVERFSAAEAAQALSEYQGDEPEMRGEPHDDIIDEERITKLQADAVRMRSVSVDKEPGPHGGTIEKVEVKEETFNVFKDDSFDLVEEMKMRTEESPYIITHDEFYMGEKNYDTETLTYYELDDVLCDEASKPMDAINAKVGDDHLVRFGSGSKDPNIVFIRNDKLSVDYEIVRSKGSYLEEVLGMPNEEPGTLKHSDRSADRRAFRRGEG